MDKLILAAMIDDAQANQGANHLSATASIPSGRGIGYFAGQRDGFAQIPTPSNRSEYELYRLLERANLLNYFGTFLNFGGDDVQQLCDADEEEFLEIMSLVGMTRKPLHVRRLQKALIEWRESRDLEISMLRSSHLNYFMTQPTSIARCDQAPNSTGSSSVPPVTYQQNETNSPMRPQQKAPTEQSHYISPRDLLVGAPKRIRLLDGLHDRQRIESAKSDCTNQSPFKKRFSSAVASNHQCRGEHRSDEDASEDDGEIEVMDSTDNEQSNDDNDDVPKSRKLRADHRSSPVVSKTNHSFENVDEAQKSASPKRSHSEAYQSNRSADSESKN